MPSSALALSRPTMAASLKELSPLPPTDNTTPTVKALGAGSGSSMGGTTTKAMMTTKATTAATSNLVFPFSNFTPPYVLYVLKLMILLASKREPASILPSNTIINERPESVKVFFNI